MPIFTRASGSLSLAGKSRISVFQASIASSNCCLPYRLSPIQYCALSENSVSG